MTTMTLNFPNTNNPLPGEWYKVTAISSTGAPPHVVDDLISADVVAHYVLDVKNFRITIIPS